MLFHNNSQSRKQQQARSSRACEELLRFSAEGRVDPVKQLLQQGVPLNSTNTMKETALHLAACHGHASVVTLLLQRGASIDSRDWYSRTALMVASSDGQVKIVRMLLDAGAKPNLVDSSKRSALQWAKEHEHNDVAMLLQNYSPKGKL